MKKERGGLVSIKMLMVFLFAAMFVTLSDNAAAQTQFKGEDVLIVADEMPSLPGGEAAIRESIGRNLRYPESALERNIDGKVFVKFIVTKDGSVANVTISRSVDSSIDEEAIRVVKMLPKFTPGKKDGKPVNVWYSLPISFQLNK